MSHLLALAERITTKGLAAGADEIEVYVEQARSMTISLERNDIDSGQSIVWSGVGIRVLKNQSLAFSALNQLDEFQGKKAAERAVSMAKKAPPCPHYSLPDPKPTSMIPGLYDPHSETFSVDDALDHASRLLQTIKDYDRRIMVDSGDFHAVIGERAIFTSKSIQESEQFSGFTWSVLGMAVEGTDVGSFDYELDGVIKPSNIEVEPTAERFCEKVLGALGAQKTDSFKGSILLTPYAASRLVLSPVLVSSNAENIQKGMSRFAGKLDTRVASECLTINDNGTLPSELGSSRFDREGQPHQPLTLVKHGIFKEIMFHAFSANHAGTTSTGHASGSYRSPPGIAPTNITIKSGSFTREELIAEIKRGILVTRLSGGPHPLSGDFSAVAKGGYLIENGQIVHPVKELTVQGNIYDSLNQITRVSKETRKVSGIGLSGGSTLEAPFIVLDEVSFSS